MRLLMLGMFLLLLGCQDAQEAVVPAVARSETKATKALPVGTLTETDLAAEAPEVPELPMPQEQRSPAYSDAIPAAEVKSVRMQIYSERGYRNAQQQFVVDVLERDLAYLSLLIETPEGFPVSGAKPTLKAKGQAKIVPVTQAESSGKYGEFEFGVTGGKMGTGQISVSFLDATQEIIVNVISLQAAGYQGVDLNSFKDVLPWEELLKARLKFTDNAVTAEFPASVTRHNHKLIKLVGFMMPLEPEEKQKHFLLTSNPPSCFFHIPGGPSGAVEVFSEDGIATTWDPLVLEGRFETSGSAELGVIYRLSKARKVGP